jgi:putative ABC transport system substrate-binding protein
MNRRGFIRISGLALAWSASAAAQPTGKTRRIGWFSTAPVPDNLEAFRGGLRALGRVEGSGVVIEQRYAGTVSLAEAAAEIVRMKPDIIVADGSAGALALKPIVGSIPVVFVSGDPLGFGVVSSLSRPGGGMTGLALVSRDLNVKRLELLKEAFPGIARVGVLYEARQAPVFIPPIEAGARALGLSLARLQVNGPDDIESAFARAARERVDTVMPLSSVLFDAEKHRIVRLASKYRLPAMYEHRPYPEAGGLMSYGPDIHDVFRRAAGYVDRILNGARPAELPVEQPAKFELVVNLRTARAMGLSIPASVLLRADRVIE